jgi:hypothetical protein
MAQRPEPDDPTLRYSGSGRSDDKLRHFTATSFYQTLLPETQNILRHVRRGEWLRPPQVAARLAAVPCQMWALLGLVPGLRGLLEKTRPAARAE